MHSITYGEILNRPATIEDAIKQTNSVAGDDDALLDRLLNAATTTVEVETAMQLTHRHATLTIWGLEFEPMPTEIEIPAPIWPVESIEAITYRNASGFATALDLADVQTQLNARPSRFAMLPGKSWPEIAAGYYDQLQLDLIVGSESASESARQAVLLLVSHWFIHREAAMTGNTSGVALAYQTLVDQLRLYRYP